MTRLRRFLLALLAVFCGGAPLAFAQAVCTQARVGKVLQSQVVKFGADSVLGVYVTKDSTRWRCTLASGPARVDTVWLPSKPDTVLVPAKPDTVYLPPPPAPAPAPAPAPVPAPPPAPPGPPSPPGTWPNEPPGMTPITERSFDATVENGWLGGGAFSIISDSAAPRSPGNVGQALFRPTMGCGTGPINTYYTWATSRGIRTLYIAFAVKVSSNWVGNVSGVNKILFIQTAGGGNPAYVRLSGAGAGALVASVNFQGMGIPHPTMGVSWNTFGTLPASDVPRGQWVRWEILLQMNTPGLADGQLRYWINGTLVNTTTANIGFSSAAQTGAKNTFTGVSWNPTYGGGCPPPPADQWMYMDHIRVSGKP